MSAQSRPPSTSTNPLAGLLRVCESAMHCETLAEAATVLANRMPEFLNCDRALLLECRPSSRPEAIAVSGGLAKSVQGRMQEMLHALNQRHQDKTQALVLDKLNSADTAYFDDHLQSMQGCACLWFPLLKREEEGPARYVLWLERWQGQTWSKEEVNLLQHAQTFFAHSLEKHTLKRRSGRSWKVYALVALLLTAVLCIPVRNTTTAPALVSAQSPRYIFAPLKGTIEKLLVEPNQSVEPEDLLLRYDTQVLDAAIEDANNQVRVERAELQRLQAAAFSDAEARANLTVQVLKVELAEAAADFSRQQRGLADVQALATGIVILDDPDQWIGAPTDVGQTIMRIADPAKTKLKIQVPISDIGLIQAGQTLAMRLDQNPLHSLDAEVTRIAFDSNTDASGVPSVLVEAQWQAPAPTHLLPGQRGSAKIYSEPRALFMQIFRKPLISLRDFLNL